MQPRARQDPAGLPAREIRFEGVGFHYPGSQRAVLDGLDLVLPAGRCTAIVGLNGAGKTTLVKLLARLLRADRGPPGGGRRGRAHPFGVDDWRRRIGVIFQDYNRYELSAADNIERGLDRARVRTGTASASPRAAAGVLATPTPSPTSRSRHAAGRGSTTTGGPVGRAVAAPRDRPLAVRARVRRRDARSRRTRPPRSTSGPRRRSSIIRRAHAGRHLAPDLAPVLERAQRRSDRRARRWPGRRDWALTTSCSRSTARTRGSSDSRPSGSSRTRTRISRRTTNSSWLTRSARSGSERHDRRLACLGPAARDVVASRPRADDGFDRPRARGFDCGPTPGPRPQVA